MKKLFVFLIMSSMLICSCAGVSAGNNSKTDKTLLDQMVNAGIISQEDVKGIVLSEKMTRAQYISYLHKVLDIKINYFVAPDITKVFKDVKNTDAFAGNLSDMVTTGIVDDKIRFRPNTPVTREEAVYYLIRGYNYQQKSEINDYSIIKSHSPAYRYVKDITKIKPKFKNTVLKAYSLGLIDRTLQKSFGPKQKVSNSEGFKMLLKLHDIIIKTDKGEVVNTLEYTFLLNKTEFEMKSTLRNNSKKDVAITFGSGQEYNFILLDKDKKEIYNWGKDRMFTQDIHSITLKPGEKKDFKEKISAAMSSIKYDDIMKNAVYLKGQILGKTSDGKGFEDIIVEINK